MNLRCNAPCTMDRRSTCGPVLHMRVTDLTGHTFGRLTVIEQAWKEGRTEAHWKCICVCGTTKIVSGGSLRHGRTVSCGCFQSEQIANRNKAGRITEPWLVDMKQYVRRLNYVSSRWRQTHPWALSLEDYKRLVTARCYYCGRLPDQEPRSSLMREMSVKRNGIDRVDNTKGYAPTNCVPCCTTCNREKGFQSHDAFIENTRRRYEHLKSEGLLT